VPDHDALFKRLLSTFFLDFVELFAPELAREVEPGSLQLIDKEAFGELGAEKRQQVDLLARVHLRASERAPSGAYVLVHVEAQSGREPDFGRRMYRYFEGLDLKHSQPVYPIALFSFERPRRRQAARFDLRLPGLHVLCFRFRVVQLNRLDWRAFLTRANPVAVALMARMRIAPGDRAEVKVACLRLLATLRLDPSRTKLVSWFLDSYLRLSERERTLYEEELREVPGPERERIMEMVTSWMEEGIERGREEATLNLVLRLLARRLGGVPIPAGDRVRSLPLAALDALADALLDFRTVEDLERWLSDRASV
jgi:hypothetical protein